MAHNDRLAEIEKQLDAASGHHEDRLLRLYDAEKERLRMTDAQERIRAAAEAEADKIEQEIFEATDPGSKLAAELEKQRTTTGRIDPKAQEEALEALIDSLQRGG